MPRRSLLVALGVVLACQGCGKGKPAKPAEPYVPPWERPTPLVALGIRQPPVKAAADAGLADDVTVVGVVVGGKARAYSLPALSPMDRQIVNDLLGDVPVTITYCARTNCLRVFTAQASGRPLDVSQMGLERDGLLIKYDGETYAQATGKRFSVEGPDLPLAALKHERTTWKAWREKHPETDVYVGPDTLPDDDAEG